MKKRRKLLQQNGECCYGFSNAKLKYILDYTSFPISLLPAETYERTIQTAPTGKTPVFLMPRYYPREVFGNVKAFLQRRDKSHKQREATGQCNIRNIMAATHINSPPDM